MTRHSGRVWITGEARTSKRDRWLLSYADFMTLLLALFVILYASARVDAEGSHDPFTGLRAAFFFDESSPSPVPALQTDSNTQPSTQSSPAPITPQVRLEKDITRELERQKLRLGEDHGASLFQSERGLVISLASAEFFPAGGVEIPEDRKAVLGAIAPLLAANSMRLRFEGHTDDQPIQSDQFPSNWELSGARASAVARLFIDEYEIDPRRVATVGYAEYRPMTTNDGAADRSLNRRVEIVVLQDGQLVAIDESEASGGELNRLLDGLPPIPIEADESLRPEDLGPPPEDIPLP